METQATPATTFDASGTARDLCALSDEQILDIAPEPTAPATMITQVYERDAKLNGRP